MKLSRLTLGLALASGAPLLAHASPTVLPDQVITSGRIAESADKATAATSLFTRDDIERLQVRSVADLLNRVPGVVVKQTGGRGSQSGVFLRGTHTSQTLVLVDGQRIASASAGGASLEFLSIDQIERVEVVRGSRSALYGSDAIGGVIQIFTRRGQGGFNPRARLAYGSENTWQRSLGLSGGDQRSRFELGASLDETRGIDATRDQLGADGDHDGYRNQAFNASLSHDFSDRVSAGLSALQQSGQIEFDDAFSNPPGEYQADFRVSSLAAHLQAELASNWTSRLELGYSEDRRETRNSLYSWAESDMVTYRDSAGWINTFQLADQHQLIAGVDWHQDRLHSSTVFDRNERDNLAGYLQHRYQGERFSTELGVRRDDNEQFGIHDSLNAALTLPVNARNSLILSYAEGFRAPTFNDLYAPPGWGANPQLQPERARSYELQWRSRPRDGSELQVSVYRSDIRDAVATVGGQRTNIAVARVNGFEASLQQQLFGWQAQLGLSLIDPRDRATGQVLPNRPKRTLSLDLDRQFGAFGLGAGWRAVSRSEDDGAYDSRFQVERQQLAGYGLLELRGNWQATPQLRWDLKVDNLLDKDYSQSLYQRNFGDMTSVYGYREAGRSATLALSWTPSF